MKQFNTILPACLLLLSFLSVSLSAAELSNYQGRYTCKEGSSSQPAEDIQEFLNMGYRDIYTMMDGTVIGCGPETDNSEESTEETMRR